MLTIGELREVCQPPHVRTRAAAEHWVAHAYLRRVSPYLTRHLLAAGLSANAVTWLMIAAGALAAALTAVPGWVAALAAAAAVQLQMLLDCSDGEVARWRGTSSPRGVYLDRVGHYTAECGIALGLGVRVALGDGYADGPWWADPALTLGALLALLVALNKVENDLVHVSRAQAGMPAVRDAEEVRAPRPGLLRAARRAARVVPFHRAFHSVELSLLVLAAAVLDACGIAATAVLLPGLLAAVAVTVVGHLAAVLASPRLR